MPALWGQNAPGMGNAAGVRVFRHSKVAVAGLLTSFALVLWIVAGPLVR